MLCGHQPAMHGLVPVPEPNTKLFLNLIVVELEATQESPVLCTEVCVLWWTSGGLDALETRAKRVPQSYVIALTLQLQSMT